MTTARDLIDGALRLLQVLSDDVVLTANEANDALETANAMLDSWSTESLLIPSIVHEQWPVTGAASYTWGTGGDWNSARPTTLLQANIHDSNGIDFPMKIMAFDDFAAIKLKSLEVAYPEFLYIDDAYPLATVQMWPIPDDTAFSVDTYAEKPFTQFATLTEVVSLPPGYVRALRYNLAIDLAPEYQVSAGAEVIRIATEAKANIKRQNRRLTTMQVDPALLNRNGARFNIYRGD